MKGDRTRRALARRLVLSELQQSRAVRPAPLEEVETTLSGDFFRMEIDVPDEDMMRCDVLIEPWGPAVPNVKINGRPVAPDRRQINRSRWTLSSYDLRAYRSRTVSLEGRLAFDPGSRIPADRRVQMEAWLVVDRQVDPSPARLARPLPFPISRGYRRQTMELIRKTTFTLPDKRTESPRLEDVGTRG